MNKLIIATLTIAAVSAVQGTTTNQLDAAARRAHIQETMRQGNMRANGGYVRKAGSAKGRFVVLNAQKLVGEAAIRPVLESIDKRVMVDVALKPAEGITVDNAGGRIAAAGGTLGVALVDDPSLPSLLTAPESGWSVVNVRKLSEGTTNAAVVASRTRKEILRSFAFVSGCAYATMGDYVMRDVAKPGDLDSLQKEEFGAELMNKIRGGSSSLYGLTPWYQTTYRKACQEGWAPAPTNKYQKAIWDKVHAMPAEPIKIKPETKKVTE